MPEPSAREAELLAALAERDQRIKLLEQKIDLLIKRLFGAKNEKLDPSQLLLLLQEDSPGKSEEHGEKTEVAQCSKEESTPSPETREGRKAKAMRLPEDLPVIEEVIEPEAVKAKPQQWRRIGEEISERLDYEPARFVVLRTVRPKYVPREGVDGVPLVASLPPVILERGIVGPGLLAQVVVAKYCEHLPLYRQESIYWSRHNVRLPRQSLSEWMEVAAEWLKPVYREIRKEVVTSGYVQVDETPVRYLAPGTGKTRLGYFWACAVPNGDVVYEWHTNRSAQCLRSVLPEEFKGIVQCDGYEAYDAMARERGERITLASCMAHIRRKIFEAKDQAPRVAGWLLRQIQNLYAIEAGLRSSRAGPRLRQATRASQARPILWRMRAALLRLRAVGRYLPKSAMGRAINYALVEWSGLTAYQENGRVELDNNRVENAIRPTAIGKKNWLFIGDAEAGDRSAILYTIIEACRRQEIDPFTYLRDVFRRVPGMTNQNIHTVTPANWAKQQRAAEQPLAA